jgi:signal transduction histidine kinase
MDIIKRSSDRINQLITELLNISRPAALNMKNESVNTVLEDTLQLANDRIKLKKIQTVKRLDANLPFKMLDHEKMKTAFLNIIINAVEAMDEEKGVLTINTRKDNGHCIVEISDNGHGISPDNLQNLFQPFFSQKSKGMGLGLTASHNIILTHQGWIDVESREGEGTKFTIAL